MRKINNDFFDEENTVGIPEEDQVFSKKSKKPKKEKPHKEGKSGGKKTVLIVVCCVVAVAILAAVALVFVTQKAEERRQQEVVDQILNIDVFHEGVVIDGVDVTGLTKEEAKQYIEAAHAEAGVQQYTILKNYAYEQALAAAAQREAEETAKQEAAAADAAKDNNEAPEDIVGGDPDVEQVLDENGLPVEVPVEETTETEEETLAPALYTEDENGNFILNAECVAISYNIDEVLDEAFNLAKSGTYEELLAEIEDIKLNGRVFTTTRTLDVSGTKAALEQISERETVAAVDAKVEFNTNYVAEGGETATAAEKFNYIDEVPGVTVDAAATYAALDALAQQDTIGEVEMITTEIAPATTVEMLKNKVVLRASATTNFSGKRGYAERVWNITKATGMINGMTIQPGETFSMNGVLGVRNKANGWKLAGALSGGQADVKQYGGGVCQVSTTLYNAVVKADLEVVYRQAHSERSSYVAGGLDATINSVGNEIDFKWKNNTNSPVIIIAYTVDYDLHVDIYGEPFATDEYDEIRLTSQKLSDIQPDGEMTYKLDKTKPASYSQVLVPRRVGSKWQSYKNYYKNGQLVKTEKLATSIYRAYAGVTVVGQLPNTSPSPSNPGTTAPSTPTPTPPIVEPTPTPDAPTPETSG